MNINVQDIMDYENGEMEEDQVIEFFDGLIRSGSIFSLQGSYQRTANNLIQQGLVAPPGRSFS